VTISFGSGSPIDGYMSPGGTGMIFLPIPAGTLPGGS
jgi:hypothetical protein